MKNLLIILIAAITVSFFSSCKVQNIVPYTNAIKAKYNVEPADLQFYLIGEDITLKQDSTEVVVNLKKGAIKQTKKTHTNEVFIEQLTPGLSVSGDNNPDKKLLVKFTEKEDAYLSFVLNPGVDSAFTLAAKNWTNGKGVVHYGDKEYFTNAKNAKLGIDENQIKKQTNSFKKLKGAKK